MGIANKPYLGRCCVVWLCPDVERLVPVAATDLEFDPRSISRTPLCLEALHHLLEVFEEASHGHRNLQGNRIKNRHYLDIFEFIF